MEIRFDQVFSIVRGRYKYGRFTNFGFESKGKRTYDVSVPGWPVIEPGMTVVALFAKENDWSSLLGWVDSYGHQIVNTNPLPVLSLSISSIFFLLLVLSGNFPVSINLLAIAFFGAPALWLLAISLKQFRLHKEVLFILNGIRQDQLTNRAG